MTLSDTRAQLITLASRCDIPMLARRYRDLATAYERLTAATGRQSAPVDRRDVRRDRADQAGRHVCESARAPQRCSQQNAGGRP